MHVYPYVVPPTVTCPAACWEDTDPLLVIPLRPLADPKRSHIGTLLCTPPGTHSTTGPLMDRAAIYTNIRGVTRLAERGSRALAPDRAEPNSERSIKVADRLRGGVGEQAAEGRRRRRTPTAPKLPAIRTGPAVSRAVGLPVGQNLSKSV